MHKIRVMIVEDDPFWLERLTVDIGAERDIEVVATASNKADTLEQIQTCYPDILLLDIHLTGNRLDGIELLRDNPEVIHCPVIMLTSMVEQEIILEAFAYGAVNFLHKSSVSDIIQTIRDCYQGRMAIHPDAATVLRKAFVMSTQLDGLTPVEKEVFKLDQLGYNKPQIAAKLNKSFATIKNQLRTIRRKLGRIIEHE